MATSPLPTRGRREYVRLTEPLVREVFGLACRVVPDPETGTPMVVPARRDAHVRH